MASDREALKARIIELRDEATSVDAIRALNTVLAEVEALAAHPSAQEETLLDKAIADRDLRPWRYYRLDYDDLIRGLDRYADVYGRVPPLPPPPAGQETHTRD